LRQEASDKLRVTIISPGFVRTNLAKAVTNSEVKTQIEGALNSHWRYRVRLSLAHSFALTGATRPSLPVGERKRIACRAEVQRRREVRVGFTAQRSTLNIQPSPGAIASASPSRRERIEVREL